MPRGIGNDALAHDLARALHGHMHAAVRAAISRGVAVADAEEPVGKPGLGRGKHGVDEDVHLDSGDAEDRRRHHDGDAAHVGIAAGGRRVVGARFEGRREKDGAEQARGKVVDKRADIWAFGAVLFEMLTGARAFPGEDITDTLAAVVRAEPNWAALPA